MPVASMVTGAAVTAALGDQIRDNLVALNDGWWFYAKRTTSFTAASGSPSTIGLDSLTRSRTATDEGSISLVGNNVQVNKAGLWKVGAHYTFAASATVALVGVSYTDGISGAWAFQDVIDSATGTQTDVCGSGAAEVITVPTIFTLWYFQSGAPLISSNSRSPVMWGHWEGDRP
jgi:hypothetical protein